MAFVANNQATGRKLGERLGELMAHSERLDMLVGFFFSGVKVLYDAIKARAGMKMRVMVGMEAEMAMGHLAESLQRGGDDSANAIKDRFLESMKKIVGSSEVDARAFHERLDLFVEMLGSRRLELRRTHDPNHAKLYIFTMDEATKTLREKIWIAGSSNFGLLGLCGHDQPYRGVCREEVSLQVNQDHRRQLLAGEHDESAVAAILGLIKRDNCETSAFIGRAASMRPPRRFHRNRPTGVCNGLE